MAKTLQVNFTLTVPADEWRKIAAEVAPAFAAVPGLITKIWNHNEERAEVAGFYLFRDAESLDAYAASPLAKQVASGPFLKDLSVKTFDVMEDVTRVTNGGTLFEEPATA